MSSVLMVFRTWVVTLARFGMMTAGALTGLGSVADLLALGLGLAVQANFMSPCV